MEVVGTLWVALALDKGPAMRKNDTLWWKRSMREGVAVLPTKNRTRDKKRREIRKEDSNKKRKVARTYELKATNKDAAKVTEL